MIDSLPNPRHILVGNMAYQSLSFRKSYPLRLLGSSCCCRNGMPSAMYILLGQSLEGIQSVGRPLCHALGTVGEVLQSTRTEPADWEEDRRKTSLSWWWHRNGSSQASLGVGSTAKQRWPTYRLTSNNQNENVYRFWKDDLLDCMFLDRRPDAPSRTFRYICQ